MVENNKYRIQHLRGTTTEWTNVQDSFIPLAGEFVIEIDEENSLHKLKIGDGVHYYKDLAYLKAENEIISQVLPRTVKITLDKDNWVSVGPNDEITVTHYQQSINFESIQVTPYSRLDLQPDLNTLQDLNTLGITLSSKNYQGNIVIRAVGKRPLNSYVIQGTLLETELVDDDDSVSGIPVGGGQTNSSMCANAIEKTSTDNNILCINDVSPISHLLNIKVTQNETVENPIDLSTVTIRQYGKNLFPIDSNNIMVSAGSFTFDDNGIYGQFGDGASHFIIFSSKYPSGTYSFSADFSSESSQGKKRILVSCYDADGNIVTKGFSGYEYLEFYSAFMVDITENFKTFIIPDNVAYWYLGWVPLGSSANTPESMKFPQLEYGDNITHYEPCTVNITNANNDGVVKGLMNISPCTTLISDNLDIIINCTYNSNTKKYVDDTITGVINDFGNNIKTINGNSLIGVGDITIGNEGTIIIDDTYTPESKNAQSGKAVAQAISENVDSIPGLKTPEGGELFNDYTHNTAKSPYSHAGGLGTQATSTAQTAIGKWNEAQDLALFIVGNGANNEQRSNAFEVLYNGTLALACGLGENIIDSNPSDNTGWTINNRGSSIMSVTVNGTYSIGTDSEIAYGCGPWKTSQILSINKEYEFALMCSDPNIKCVQYTVELYDPDERSLRSFIIPVGESIYFKPNKNYEMSMGGVTITDNTQSQTFNNVILEPIIRVTNELQQFSPEMLSRLYSIANNDVTDGIKNYINDYINEALGGDY